MNQTIIHITPDLSWLDAYEVTKSKGGLPSNVLHDEYLVMSEKWKELPGYYAAWCRELLIYPEQNGLFHKGVDVIDEYKDDKDREWIFPAKYIPKSAISKQGVALFVDPERVELTNDKVIIHPKKVTVLNNFPQKDKWSNADIKTRVPLEVTDAELKKLPDNQKRYLYRRSGITVRPVARDFGIGYDFRRGVNANGRPDNRLGVAYVQGASSKEEKHKHRFICECGKVKR